MSMIRLTKEFSFEMAHSLAGYDGLCSEIHGHSYRLFVTIIGTPLGDESDPKLGMVLDFGTLKRIVGDNIVQRYDHALVMRSTATNREVIKTLSNNFNKLEVVDYQPTCENMISRFAAVIMEKLPHNVKLHSLKLHETATSFAEWYAQDNVVTI